MKKKVAAALFLATAAITAGCTQTSEKESEIILTSKAGDITKEELYQELKASNGAQTLDSMAGRLILMNSFPVEEKEVKDEIATYKEQLGGEEGFESYLASNNSSVEQFTQDVEYSMAFNKALAKDAGMTDEALTKFAEENADLLKQVDANHILVATEEEATKVLSEINGGKSFEDAAREYSTDGSASEGGPLGYFGKGSMVAEFEEVAFSLEKGKISEPVKTQFGYHIIRVNDTRVLSLEENKEEIEYLFLNDHGTLSQEFITELFESNEVQVLDETLQP